MKEGDADWTLYRTFLHIMRHGTLSAAGRALSLAHPTVRRHLGELEAVLGGPLFTRSTSGLLPTALAQRVVVHAEAMETAAGAIARAATEASDGIGGVVRITASEIVGTEVLPPMLAALRNLHPRLSFELLLSNDEADVLRREVDIAIRMVRPRQGSLIARKVGVVPVGLYAHEAWLARNPTPVTLAALGEMSALIGHDRRTSFAAAFAAAGVPIGRANLAMATDSDIAQVAAVRAGMGIGPFQIPLAARSVELRRVLPSFTAALELWVVTHPDLRDVPTFRAVVNGLLGGLKEYLSS